MKNFRTALMSVISVFLLLPVTSHSTLISSDILIGNVDMSIDAVGSNNSPTGQVQANIPIGSTILKAYLYSVGTPYPWYSNSPRTVSDYNGAGITLGGLAITNFSKIVGATSTRPELGTFFTGRADVTDAVKTLATGGPNYSWSVTEGNLLNNRIDGEVLAIAYSNPLLPQGSVVFLDGGQATGGENTTVNFGTGLTGVGTADFFADMSLAISFSTGDDQHSNIDINGTRLSSSAGGYDDGGLFDGGLITAGGIGDSNANPAAPSSTARLQDDEFYSLTPFLNNGDTSFNIFTQNPTNDDNIFFMGLHLAGEVSSVNPDPVPEPSTFLLFGVGLAGVALLKRKHRR